MVSIIHPLEKAISRQDQHKHYRKIMTEIQGEFNLSKARRIYLLSIQYLQPYFPEELGIQTVFAFCLPYTILLHFLTVPASSNPEKHSKNRNDIQRICQ